MTQCQHDPRKRLRLPLGMYRCPDCGCAVLAALPHPPCEDDCPYQDGADRTRIAELEEVLRESAGRGEDD